MIVLIDTHCWLWWISEPERLSGRILSLLKNSETTILFSAASSWEIAIKYSIGKLSLPEPPELFIPRRLERDRITSLPIHHSHAIRTASLPYHHRDPFDRLLIAQAEIEGVPIVTVDSAFRDYDVRLIEG